MTEPGGPSVSGAEAERMKNPVTISALRAAMQRENARSHRGASESRETLRPPRSEATIPRSESRAAPGRGVIGAGAKADESDKLRNRASGLSDIGTPHGAQFSLSTNPKSSGLRDLCSFQERSRSLRTMRWFTFPTI